MTIDFSSLELDEDTKTQLDSVMSNEIVSTYLSQSIENREQAIRESGESDYKKLKSKLDEFRETNIKQQKELEQYEAIDLEEYAKLKALGSDAKAAAEKLKANDTEWNAKVSGLSRKVEEYETKLAEVEKQREKDSMRFNVLNAISEWNIKNPQLAVENGADKVIVDTALSSYKMLDGKPVMQRDGRDFTTDNGFGSIGEWIGSVAKETLPFCFKRISGGGASGSSGGATIKKPLHEMTGSEQLKLKRSDPETYNRLKQQGYK